MGEQPPQENSDPQKPEQLDGDKIDQAFSIPPELPKEPEQEKQPELPSDEALDSWMRGEMKEKGMATVQEYYESFLNGKTSLHEDDKKVPGLEDRVLGFISQKAQEEKRSTEQGAPAITETEPEKIDNLAPTGQELPDLGQQLNDLIASLNAEQAKRPEEAQEKREPIPVGAEIEQPPETEKDEKEILATELLRAFSDFADRIKYKEGSDEILQKGEDAGTLWGKAGGIFRGKTGKNFNEEVIERTKQAVQEKGYRAITKKEWFGLEHTKQVRDREKQRVWGAGVRAAWEKLSDQERAAYGSDKDFARQLESQRKDLVKKGFILERDEYYQLFRDGYDPRTLKEPNWVRGLFGAKVEIKKINGIEKEKIDFDRFMGATKHNFDRDVESQVSSKLSDGFEKARTRWLRTKLEKAGDVVLEATGGYGETNSSDVGPVKPASVAVRSETLTLDQQEALIKEETERRTEQLNETISKIIKDAVDVLALNTEQENKLRKYLTDGQGSFEYDFEDVMEKIKKVKDDIKRRSAIKRGTVREKRNIKMRETIHQRLAELGAI